MQKKQVSLVRMALSLILSCKGFGKHFIADEDEGCGHGLFLRVYHQRAEVQQGIALHELGVINDDDGKEAAVL